MYIPLVSEIALLKLVLFMFGYIAITILIVGIICAYIEYIESRED